jgi:hypothetical protein
MADEMFWSWCVVDGVTTNWVICRDGTLITSRVEYASDKSISSSGYITNHIAGKMRDRHQLMAPFLVNPRPDLFDMLDHIDEDKTNNHADNLRWVNRTLNRLNVTSKKLKPKKGYKSKPYRAQIRHNRNILLGYYATEKEAMDVQDKTRKSLFAALYHFLTRPNTFLEPENWIITPCRVRVRI